jgi:predicted nucleic acid-binding protein
MILVADASCLAASLLSLDARGAWASTVLGRADAIHVPQVLHVEVISSLRKAELRALCTPAQATTALQLLMSMPLQTWSLEGLHPRVWSLRHNVTPYDAWYVALAEHIEVPLATCDVRLARAEGLTCAFLTPV